jgi:uncharacterized membrane protein
MITFARLSIACDLLAVFTMYFTYTDFIQKYHRAFQAETFYGALLLLAAGTVFGIAAYLGSRRVDEPLEPVVKWAIGISAALLVLLVAAFAVIATSFSSMH